MTHKLNRIFHALLVTTLALAITLGSSIAVFAETATGIGTVTKIIPVSGMIDPLIISITHPVAALWHINPNNAVPFTSLPVEIVNNSACAVKVSVSGLSKNNNSTMPFVDTAYDAKNWPALSLADSKTYLALGVKIKTEGSAWNAGYNTATRWAVDEGTTLFGSLDNGSVGIFEFEARHGFAFDVSYIANHILEFIFALN